MLRENGVPGYQRSQAPFDWLGGRARPATCSSAPGLRGDRPADSRFGLPISEDMLGPPLLALDPMIYINAERAGLDPDDLVAYDLRDGAGAINDCNDNGGDALDIANGGLRRQGRQGVPDEEVGAPDCDCDDTAEWLREHRWPR